MGWSRHSTLHGVVFAIFVEEPAVRAAPRPGRSIVGASRIRRIDSTPTHHAWPPFGGLGFVFISRYRTAPPSRLVCWLRSTANASSGTSFVITDPEPT